MSRWPNLFYGLLLFLTVLISHGFASPTGDLARPLNPAFPSGSMGSNSESYDPSALASTAFSGAALSADLRSQLQLLREEEKLARDVYLSLHQTWQLPVIANIAQAEQRHLEMMGKLLARHGIPDPIVDTTPGVFADRRLQALYASLTQEGQLSPVSALRVGLQIEELDIADLRTARQSTQVRDIQQVLSNLERASRNHLRAFARQVAELGGEVSPQHLSLDEFSRIVQSSMETGPGQNAGGNAARSGSGTAGARSNGLNAPENSSGGQARRGGRGASGGSRGRGGRP